GPEAARRRAVARARTAARSRGLPQGRTARASGGLVHGAIFHHRRHTEAGGVQRARQSADPALRCRVRHRHELRRVATENCTSVFDPDGHQGARRQTVDATLGAISRTPARDQERFRARNHEIDERGHGPYHHFAPARRPGPGPALHAQARRTRRPTAQERPRLLPQPFSRDAVPAQEARQVLSQLLTTLPRSRALPAEITGQNSSTSASVVKLPTSQFDQNTARLPCEISIAWRKALSAMSPSTSARTIGASG